MAEKRTGVVGKTIESVGETVYETGKGIGEGVVGGAKVLLTGHEQPASVPRVLYQGVEGGQAGAERAGQVLGEAKGALGQAKEAASSALGMEHSTSKPPNVFEKIKAGVHLPDYPDRDPLSKK